MSQETGQEMKQQTDAEECDVERVDVSRGACLSLVHQDEGVRQGLDDDKEAQQRHPEEKVHKELVVIEADTVAHPRTCLVCCLLAYFVPERCSCELAGAYSDGPS